MSLIDRIEPLLGDLAEQVEKFSGDRLRIIIACALAAGLSIPVALFGLLRISVLWRINTPSWAFILTFTLACVTCYMTSALLLIWAKQHRKNAFGWVWMIILGSFILAVFNNVWATDISRHSVYDLVFAYLHGALERTAGLSLFTLPFAALVNYSGSIVRAVRLWHNGREYSLSLLGK